MKATATESFLRNEEDVSAGQEFVCERPEFEKWAALGFIQPYETKAPAPKKKARPSAASRPVQASTKRTSGKRGSKATKS